MKKKDKYISIVLKKSNDLQTSKAGGSGVVGKPRNDKKGDVQHTRGVDVQVGKS